jgi:hypothetical protein
MTEQDIISAGFKAEKTYDHLNDKHDKCWSYSEKDSIGRKFSIIIKFWRTSKYSTPERIIPDGYSFDGYFRDKDDQHFIVSMSKDLEPEEVIKWCRNLYEKLGCGYVTKFE